MSTIETYYDILGLEKFTSIEEVTKHLMEDPDSFWQDATINDSVLLDERNKKVYDTIIKQDLHLIPQYHEYYELCKEHPDVEEYIVYYLPDEARKESETLKLYKASLKNSLHQSTFFMKIWEIMHFH